MEFFFDQNMIVFLWFDFNIIVEFEESLVFCYIGLGCDFGVIYCD